MFKISGIDHINMYVKDLDKTVNFYKKFFDFEVKEEGFHKVPYKIIGKKNIGFFCAYEDPEKVSDNNRISHLGFHVENFEDVLSALKEENIEVLYGGTYHEHEHSKSIYIADPSGVEIELSEVFGGGL